MPFHFLEQDYLMSTRRLIEQLLSEDEQADVERMVAAGVVLTSPDDAQDALDASLHHIRRCQVNHRNATDEMEKAVSLHTRLQLVHSVMSACNGDIPPDVVVSQESLVIEALDFLGQPAVLYPSLEDYAANPARASESATTHIAETIAHLKTAIPRFATYISNNLTEFFFGFQKHCDRTMNMLAEADRLLDHAATAPKNKTLKVEGHLAFILHAGYESLSFEQALDRTLQQGNELVTQYIPKTAEYAHDMAQAFARADLSHIQHGVGFDKVGFMKLAMPFAEVKAPIPSICTIREEQRFFFGAFKDNYRERLVSKPLPGCMQIAIVHPVGDLKQLAAREDSIGFYKNFPAWVTVELFLEMAESKSEFPDCSIPVPTVSEQHRNNTKMRELVKKLRPLSLKSDEYRKATEEALNAFESHFVKQLSTPGGALIQTLFFAGNAAMEVAKVTALVAAPASHGAAMVAADWAFDATILAMIEGLGRLGYRSGKLLADAIIEIGGNYASDMNAFASISLRMAKQCKG
jgi:hypothetical protein